MIEEFIEECCVIDPGRRIKNKPLYSAYKEFCLTRDERPIVPSAFGKKLSALGFLGKRSTKDRFRLGITLKEVHQAMVELQAEATGIPEVDVYDSEGKPSPPFHLSDSMKRWWREVEDRYNLEQRHLRLLTLAAESWDRAQSARVVLNRDGMTYQNSHGNWAKRPEVGIERASGLAYARLVRELGLDVESAERKSDRPPRTAARTPKNPRAGK